MPYRWKVGATCIHRHEQREWHAPPWTIAGSTYDGGFSFLLATWESVGGSRRGWRWASPAEQYFRAYRVWRRDGDSWREWPTRRYCGLR